MYKLQRKIIPTLLVTIISLYGTVLLYSVNGGNIYPWCINQIIRFCIGFIALIIANCISMNFWKKHGYVFLFIGVLLLMAVSVIGKVSMGAQRWLNLGIFNFQPSELTKIFLIISMAKYLSERRTEDIQTWRGIIIPLSMMVIPCALVLSQPDLGTAMIYIVIVMSMLFVSGVQIWKFILGICIFIISCPILWMFLHEYQRERVRMFLDPELDPGGAGYHIIQSKIALGSGGLFGKGLLHGTQCQLNFLPEKQTDFVFAALGEELGFIGGFMLILMYVTLILYNYKLMLVAKGRFERLIIFAINSMIFFYVFINISMVCGILPVVGIPLPYFSYGGSSLVMLMFCEGMIFSASSNYCKYEYSR